MSETEKKINDTLRSAEQLKYLKDEFEGKLYGSVPDGDVKFHQIMDFAKEYDWLLVMIVDEARKL